MTLMFASEGASVVAVDVSGQQGGTAVMSSGRVIAIHADMSDGQQFAAAISRQPDEFGRLDALCNVAGSGIP